MASTGGPRAGSNRFLPPDPRVEGPYRFTPQLALRIGILVAVTLVVFGVLFFRLWALQVLSGDQYLRTAQNNQLRTIRVAAPAAHSVELTGDMTRWRVVAMTRDSDGRWSVALRLPPGVYNCNVRIDGGRWTPPPGLPTSRDDFRGEVGIMIVE